MAVATPELVVLLEGSVARLDAVPAVDEAPVAALVASRAEATPPVGYEGLVALDAPAVEYGS